MGCLPPDDVVAALESALHLKAISRNTFERLIAGAPQRLQHVLEEATPGAQSGYETHSRLRLRRAGYTVIPQVFIPGAGHIDNLIEDCVDLETDGREFHGDTFEEDRKRDLAVEWMGIRVLRVPARMVDTDWPYISSTVHRMVDEQQHRRGRL